MSEPSSRVFGFAGWLSSKKSRRAASGAAAPDCLRVPRGPCARFLALPPAVSIAVLDLQLGHAWDACSRKVADWCPLMGRMCWERMFEVSSIQR